MLFTDGMGPGRNFAGQDENYASAMMCMAIPLAYFSMLCANHPIVRLWYVVALALFIAAIVASGSRGGFLGLLAVTAFCIFYSPKRKQALAIMAIAAAAVAVKAGPAYWEEMRTISDTSEATVDDRIELWSLAWRMFVDNPVLGVGPGNYRWNTGKYQTAEQFEKYGRDLTFIKVVHSAYFEVLSELGLVGTLLIATIFVRTFRDLKRLSLLPPEHKPPDALSRARMHLGRFAEETQQFRYFSLAIAGSLIGYLVTAAFLSFTYSSHSWILIALAVALNQIHKQRVTHKRTPTEVPA
jgi:O-antigen ligase